MTRQRARPAFLIAFVAVTIVGLAWAEYLGYQLVMWPLIHNLDQGLDHGRKAQDR